MSRNSVGAATRIVKPLPWFRMYTDFLSDPKMIALAFEDQRHFIGVLALKSEGILDQDCDVKLLDRIVAQRLWIDYAIISDVKKRLVGAGLIDESWQPVAWIKRQRPSDHDPSAAERQRRHRRVNIAANVDSHDTHDDTPKDDDALCHALRHASSHADVTPLEESREEESREEKSRKEENTASNAGVGVGEPAKRARKTAITFRGFMARCRDNGEKQISDYGPLLRYIDSTGLPMEFVQLCWQEFKSEHAPPGPNAERRKSDWRLHFLGYVKKGYYRLWYAKGEGEFALTTAGIQAKADHAHREAA